MGHSFIFFTSVLKSVLAHTRRPSVCKGEDVCCFDGAVGFLREDTGMGTELLSA
jgi:hypothetical protein